MKAGSDAPELSPHDEIRFVEHHRPDLEAGDYEIHLTQDVLVTAGGEAPNTLATFSAARRVAVAGDRFELAPEVIHSVYPPAGSRGDDWHVFPHVILDRSTLPWERSACDDIEDKDRRPPWLALLLLDADEAEAVTRSVVSLAELQAADHPRWPGVTPESGQHHDDQVAVIDVPWKTLRRLIPGGLDDFAYRTHARRLTHPATLLQIRGGINVGAVAHDLDQQRPHGPLADLLGPQGITLGVDCGWAENPDGGPWVFTDPVAGRFEVTRHDGDDGPWLRVQGGPVPATGRLPEGHVHHFAAIAGVPMTWSDSLDEDRLPHALGALARGCGLVLGTPRVAAEEKGHRWRLTDPARDRHHQIVADEAGVLRIEGYGPPQAEQAVVMGSRLPAAGERSVVHLVSLEDRYEHDGADIRFTGEEVLKKKDQVRLVTLKQWDFFCLDDQRTFTGLAEGLNRSDAGEISAQLGLPVAPEPGGSSVPRGTLAAHRLLAGAVPLRHRFRRGERSVSWYHGPLVPDPPEVPIEFRLPAGHADELVIFDAETGMFDVSYAAAWELGRMLTLARTRVAESLFAFKRSHVHDLRAARHVADFGMHLPVSHAPLPDPAEVHDRRLPPDLERWFGDLSLLRGVPFRYLIPDERMLPPESLRFFTLDARWLACLRDGAFSIGRVLRGDAERDRDHGRRLPQQTSFGGVLIRSQLVSGYPGLLADAYAGGAGETTIDQLHASHLDPTLVPPLRTVRRDRLAPNILLLLFDGEPGMIDLHLRPETLHFGLDVPDPAHSSPDVRQRLARRDPSVLTKQLRARDGRESTGAVGVEEAGHLIPMPLSKHRVVDLPALADAIALAELPREKRTKKAARAVGRPGPAAFALDMIAGVPLVRLIRDHGPVQP